ncbi:uncharacterized protein LOC123722883 [Papilio machaon]|uniref:uncharacterized protein LOC123722883 n=1 Tax=Papilio machaon TaxID=76193 RepID=UPI001E663DD7|nr:uncharacterized protein LOC123722883 [Papilio machaon]
MLRTLVKTLKEAAANIKAAVSQLRERTISEEVARLEAANARLQRDMEELRRELKDIDKRRPAQPGEADIRQLLDEVSRANVETFGTILNARLAGLEDRLLPEPRRRPPLAADRRSEDNTAPASLPKAKQGAKKKVPAKEPLPTTSGTGAQDQASTSAAAPGEAPPQNKKKGKKKKKKKQPSLAAKEAAQARDKSAPTPAEAPWTTVVTRGAKKAAKKASKGPDKTRPPERPKTKLRAQRPRRRGEEPHKPRGTRHRRINLAELGIAAVKFRRAATGARILEVGGEAAPEKADSLAAKLREVLGPEKVRIGRPVKCAEVRITGLDDSVTAAEVVESVAREGGCAAEAIRSGNLAFGPRGDGSLWLSVPVAAAKMVTDAGRVRVGWTSARVVLLAPRPTRCFRCLETGHMGAKCQCEVDRSKLCFRCGKPDHRARDFLADPNCPVCEAAGKPAGHTIGGDGCVTAGQKPSKRKERGAPKRWPRRKAKKAGVERMDTSSTCWPSRDDWAGDVGNLVAISAPARDGSPPLRKVARGTGIVLVVVGGVAIVGVYFPPSWPLADFERALAEVQALTARVSHVPVIVAGDFNAKSTAWGSPATSTRGEELEDWAAASGLMLLNRGRELTCVRQQGGSIVDLSFASSVLVPKICGWKVEVDVET